MAREAWTVKFQPKVMPRIGDVTDNVAKLVGVSDDHDRVSRAWSAAHDRFGDHVTAAASQPYYRNADPGVKRAARRITDTNDNEGFAKAVERFILAAAGTNVLP